MGNNSSRVTAQDKFSSLLPSLSQSTGRLKNKKKENKDVKRSLADKILPLSFRANRAILDLKLQRDKLHQYQRRITVLTDRETAIARQMLAAGDKKRALLALRRKKYQESLLEKTDLQLAQLEQLTRNVEFALIQKDVIFGLEQGTLVLKEIHAEMGGLEHVEKLMGETADAIAYQREISEMLGGRITNQDEDEVEDELAALEREVNGPAAAAAPLPNVPDTRISVPEVKEQQRRRRQQEEAASNQERGEPERAMLAS
ncbi:Vacuolar protein sorting-associated protein 20 [Parahypoxylon ruwenzoriense]